MKKALSVVLSMLVIFSMVSIMAFAAEPPITVKFVDYDGTVIQEVKVVEGTILTEYAPANPVRPDVEGETEYTFKGWRGEDGNLYYQSTLPTPDGSDLEVIYTAEYSEKDVSGYQSFWNFIESIFERINKLFEYFAEVFNW